MSKPAQKLLERLEGVRKVRDEQWVARCPAHDDKSPSLSIRAVESGVLVHCFAGCAAETVISSIGLTFADLYGGNVPIAARGSGKVYKKTPGVDLDVEKMVLHLALSDIREGRILSIEDRARIAIAKARLESHG